MVAGKPTRAGATDLVAIKRVVRGVIYGEVERDFIEETPRTLEFFINGVSIGTTTIESSFFGAKDTYEFNFLILPSFIFEAPVNIRVREAESGEEFGEPIVFREVEETRAAILVADGVVAGVERGSLKGGLSEVNPDALPISVAVYCRGAPIARTVVGAKTTPVAPGKLISLLPFSIGLPPSILDGSSTSISVRIDGSSQEFIGSPLVIRLDAGDGLHDRLAHLEQMNQELEAEVWQLRASIVGDIAEQFYRFIVPRVDALLAIQREGLEGQMVALWRELSAEGPAPIARRKLPQSVSLSLDKAFTGFRWSDPLVGYPADRWFAHNGFIATEISSKHDILIFAKGAFAVSPAAAERLTISVNGHKIDAVVCAEDEGWFAAGVAPRSVLSDSGSLALVLETPVAGAHPLAPATLGAVSLSLASVDLTALVTSATVLPISVAKENFPFGWHPMEESVNQGKFRWMGPEALVVLTRPPAGAPFSVAVTGPMALGDALSHVTAEFNGKPARAAQVETHERGWTLTLEFAASPKNGPVAGILRLRAPAKQPSEMDPRFLSLAVSEVAVVSRPAASSIPPAPHTEPAPATAAAGAETPAAPAPAEARKGSAAPLAVL